MHGRIIIISQNARAMRVSADYMEIISNYPTRTHLESLTITVQALDPLYRTCTFYREQVTWLSRMLRRWIAASSRRFRREDRSRWDRNRVEQETEQWRYAIQQHYYAICW